MFDDDGKLILQLGTSKRIFATDVLQTKNRTVFLTKPPFNNKKPLLDNFTVLVFLSTLNNSTFKFSQTMKSEITIDGQRFTHCIKIYQKLDNIFILRYQTTGNYFTIQLCKLNSEIKFEREDILLNINSRKVNIYKNPIIYNQNSESPMKLQKNDGIQELSDFYNNVSVNRKIQNQLTASIFYSVAPFNPKTISKNRNKIINPDDTIDGVLNIFGGKYFIFKSKEEISLDEYPFKVFAWFSPYFDLIIESQEFDVMTTVELDSTFTALDPYTMCIPTIIYRNSSIPLGLLASISESTSLYSIFFESLKELDKKNPNQHFSYYQKFIEKKYLTDEHRSFIELAQKYNIEIYNCFVHLIRTIGSNSLLGYFISDLLYTYSEEQWNSNYIRMFYTYQCLFNEKNAQADMSRFNKVSHILGQDAKGNPVEQKLSYCPLYKRAADRIPTCTNHIESIHMQLNNLTSGARSLTMRLAIICKYIIDRTNRVNHSIQENLKNYINNLKKKSGKNRVS